MSPTMLALTAGSGALIGLVTRFWALSMARKRSNGALANAIFYNTFRPMALWMFAGLFFTPLIIWFSVQPITGVINCAFFYILIALSAVDFTTRKIPNPALLALLIVRVIQLIVQFDFSSLIASLIGMAAGYFFFMLPTIVGRSIGWGDVKLAAVIGFCLGWLGMFQSIAIMGLTMGLYSAILFWTRRGNLKTKVAIGPFLSLGMVLSMLFPLSFL